MVRRRTPEKRKSPVLFILIAVVLVAVTGGGALLLSQDRGGEGENGRVPPAAPAPAVSETPEQSPEPGKPEYPLIAAAPEEVLAGVEFPVAAEAGPLPAGPSIEILATRDGRLWLNGESVVPPALSARLAKMVSDGSKPVLLLSADVHAGWLSVSRILRACAADDVKLDWVMWRCRGNGGPVAVALPLSESEQEDRELSIEFQSREGAVTFEIQDPRKRPEPLDNAEISLASDLAELRRARGATSVYLRGIDVLTCQDVFRVAIAAHRAGFRSYRFRCGYTAKFDPTAPEYRLPESDEFEDPAGNAATLFKGAPREERFGRTVISCASARRLANVQVPKAAGGEEPGEGEIAEVLVTADRQFHAGGQRVSTELLTEFLFVHAERSRDTTHPSEPSNQQVVVRADARACWQDLAKVLVACADSAVRLHRIYLAVEGDDGELQTLPIFLPANLGSGMKKEILRVDLHRRLDEEAATLSLFAIPLGSGDDAYRELKGRLIEAYEQLAHDPAAISPNPTVTTADVARTISTLRRTGWTEIHFKAPPGTRRR